MAGPAIDPKAAAAIQAGATKPGYQSIVDLANHIAKGYQQQLPGTEPNAMEHVDESTFRNARDSADNPSDPAQADHMRQMQQRAEAARQQYMKENGVDENGELLR